MKDDLRLKLQNIQDQLSACMAELDGGSSEESLDSAVEEAPVEMEAVKDEAPKASGGDKEAKKAMFAEMIAKKMKK